MYTSIKLRITLCDTNPEIWRSIIVPETVTFFDLHHIFQISMGWKNSHLFEFKIGSYVLRYFDPRFDNEESIADASQVTLDLLLKPNLQFNYLYDFGDRWEHSVVVEELIHSEFPQIFPLCTMGNRNCPPEDCGGVSGFYHLLKILEDKNHVEHSDMKKWVGRYDAEKFEPEKINKELKRFKKYMKHW